MRAKRARRAGSAAARPGLAGATLITCTPGLIPASLTTMFAPNQARPTARAVPASQAARPVRARVMSAIMPQTGLRMHSVPLMARVLIIEDDPFVRSAIAADLTQRAHAVRTVGTALDGIREVSQHSPEVIVLDLGLPDLDGQQALKMMRAVTTTPVIIATARHEEAEIIRLLNAGADDYLVKPFSCEHLAARISAQLRRAGPGSAAPVISVGGLRIDLARREAVLDGTPVELSRREFDLLAYLAARPGVVVSQAGAADRGVAPVLRRRPDHRRARLVAAAQARRDGRPAAVPAHGARHRRDARPAAVT